VDYTHLNHYIAPEIDGVSEAWKRVLGRLGDYTSLVVRALNVRPTQVQLLAQTSQHVLVRITAQGSYLVLRIAPEADLSGLLYYTRTMSAHQLPVAQIIQHDLSRRMVPFAYVLERYVGGASAAQLSEAHVLRATARQAGRTLRRMHRIGVPGWGQPGPLNRWPTANWSVLLQRFQAQYAPPPTDALLFNESERQAINAMLNDNRLCCQQPRLMHGAFGPQAVRYSAGHSVQIEALNEPGSCVGGDGLLDLAQGLAPIYPAAWREGLLEGYCSTVPLDKAETQRLPLLRLLSSYWIACHNYAHAQPHEAARDEVIALVASPEPRGTLVTTA
jgi:Ser/Thr protein kinase RdoA (MazF antagonist)